MMRLPIGLVKFTRDHEILRSPDKSFFRKQSRPQLVKGGDYQLKIFKLGGAQGDHRMNSPHLPGLRRKRIGCANSEWRPVPEIRRQMHIAHVLRFLADGVGHEYGAP